MGCIKSDSDSSCEPPVTPGAQGLQIYFYQKTVCQTDTLYPEEIKEILLAIFDKEERLVTYTHESIPVLESGYFQQVETDPGLYSVVAWSGIDEAYYDLQELQPGTTKKSDLLFRLKRTQQQASDITGSKVFYGESAAVYVQENENEGDLFEKASVNMQEITNRINISITGLENSDAIEVYIESDNGSMNIDGSLASDDTVRYTAEMSEDGSVLIAGFTTLKLQTGMENTIVIHDSASGKDIFNGSLLGALLLMNPGVNLACDHDFNIRFEVEDTCQCGTYVIMKVYVNNWLVHSYETEV